MRKFKFIDLRGNDIGCAFAFFRTDLKEFIQMNQNVAWNTWRDFCNDYNSDIGFMSKECFEELLEQVPQWAFVPQE